MDYQVSARKYRPGTFDQVIGQPHVVQTLVNAITSKRIAHAFLFSGTRGVGKTTVARILAKALNCEKGPTGTPCNTCANCVEITQGTSVDVIEIDGASNTGVDDVRELRENVKFSPFRGSYRVYIIDEVHMLSNSAFNALLKTLEEPPAHVVFIFATTEIHKIPATILSRCQHYNFRRIPRVEIIERLRHVAAQDGIKLEDRSLAAIARASEGSMRDGLSLLDQAVAFGGKTLNHADLETLLGSVPQELIRDFVAAIVAQDSAAALRVVALLLDQGHDLRAYCAELVEHVRNLMVAAVVASPAGAQGEPHLKRLQGLMDLADEEIRQVVEEAKGFTVDQLQELFRIFTQAEDGVRASQHPRFVLEIAAVRATRVLAAPATNVPAVPPPAKPSQQSERAAPPAPKPEPKPVASPGAVASAPASPSVGRTGGALPTADRAVKSPVAPAPASGKAEDQARVRVAAPAPGHTGTPVSLNWEQVVEQMMSRHPHIGAFLEQGIYLGIEDNLATVGYPKAGALAYGRMQREESLRVLTALCVELAGQPLRVRVIELADGQASGATMAEVRAAKEQDRKRVLLDQARANPIVKHALSVFGGDLVNVRQASTGKEKES